MQFTGLNDLREKYLSFFESKEHLRMPSFPLVPQNDPSILLINAGMAPLKPYFTGKETPPRKRVTTCQKCIRTPDIDNVGKTARHGTFFEMLGNFSFGDYFKKEVIPWAWEFLTEVVEMPKDRLWITIYQDDDEAFDIWSKIVPAERIVRMGKEDNFWELGLGPCGPCSEIHFDRGADKGCGKPDCKLGCDCDRFMEIWNLVFTQFDKNEAGEYIPLPNPNIDTGMGLERLACLVQGVNNLFEVDTVQHIMGKISEIAGVKYHDDEIKDISLRVITDHIRSTTFMIADGVMASNEGRGYVLRRLLRRAARHGKLLGIEGTFLYKVVDTVIEESHQGYPELKEKRDYIVKSVRLEEERFEAALKQGLLILDEYIEKLTAEGKTELSGADAFKLYDTFGFPFDLTKDILADKGLSADEEGFKAEMAHQREMARSGRNTDESEGWSTDEAVLSEDIKCEFIGYDNLTCEGKVLAIVQGSELLDSANEGTLTIITDTTPFYAESGGEVGDIGVMKNGSFVAKVIDTKKLKGGRIGHIAEIVSGAVSVGDTVSLAVEEQTRLAVTRNHSATHLLQKALVTVLGSHVAQAGSNVNADRLRFDFSHNEEVSRDQLLKVEAIVNQKIAEGLTITKKVMPIDEARKLGATALFGEKYGDTVRVVTMGDFSMEFCGGCHLDNTSAVGLFKIVSESSAAAGIRRIEAVTGTGVLKLLAEKDATISETAAILKTAPNRLIERAAGIMEEMKELRHALDEMKKARNQDLAGELLAKAQTVGEITVVTGSVDGMSVDEMRGTGDKLRDKDENLLMLLASKDGDKATLIACAGKGAVAKGAVCGNIIKAITAAFGGRGGGRPDSAQGGIPADKIEEALAMVPTLLS